MNVITKGSQEKFWASFSYIFIEQLIVPALILYGVSKIKEE